MKKIIAFIMSICMVITGLPMLVYAQNGTPENSLEEFIDQAVDIINSEKPSDTSYEEEVSKRVIVKSTKKIDTFDAIDIASGFKDYYILEFPSAKAAQDAVDYYNTLAYVSFAQVDNVVTTTEVEINRNLIPDPEHHLSYNALTAGFSALERYMGANNITYSQELKIAVIDTGVEHTHEFLQGRVEPTEYNFSDSGDENSSLDDNGHGTHVAGIVVDNTPDNVIIRPYKVLNNEGKGTTLGVVLGIEQAIADDVDVINMSLSGKGYDDAMHNVIKEAYAKNIPVVVSSGNDGVNIDSIKYSPASFEECITVASSGDGEEGVYWGFRKYNNLGDVVDIAAPGDDINSCYLNNTYKFLSGTSMAAPLVSAAVAYIFLEYPDMTSPDIEYRIKDYGIPMNYTGSYLPYPNNRLHGLYVEYITRDLDLNPGVPTFSRESGEFESTFQLTLTADEGCEIYYYRFNGVVYDLVKYTKPITIKYDTTVTAYCFKRGYKKGDWVSHTYTKIFTGDESDFEIDENGTITEYLNDEEEVIVPKVLNGITVKAIGNQAFKNKSLKSVTLPDSVVSIKGQAFANCTNLEIVYASNITELGSSAFGGCSSLKYVDISKVKEIPPSAFSRCEALEVVDLSTAERIGSRAFQECKNLYSCISDQVQSVSSNAFTDSGITILDFPLITQIERYAFKGCTMLERINIPEATSVESEAFYDCINLKEINCEKVKQIDSNAFFRCQALEKIYLPAFVIPHQGSQTEKMFYGCSSLKEFIAPKMERISKDCFDNCTALEKVYAPELQIIYNSAFDNCGLNYLNAPKLKTADSLLTADHSVVVTSSALTSCTLKTPNPTLIIQGEKGSFAEKYTDQYNLEFVDVDAMGGSIRITDAGLRFGYSFYDTQDKAVEEFGFVYTTGSADSELLTLDNVNGKMVYKLTANNRITHDDGITTFNLVFTGIPKTAFNQNISARAYVKIDGRYLYSDILERSFNHVANAVLKDAEIDQATKDRIQDILAKEV